MQGIIEGVVVSFNSFTYNYQVYLCVCIRVCRQLSDFFYKTDTHQFVIFESLIWYFSISVCVWLVITKWCGENGKDCNVHHFLVILEAFYWSVLWRMVSRHRETKTIFANHWRFLWSSHNYSLFIIKPGKQHTNIHISLDILINILNRDDPFEQLSSDPVFVFYNIRINYWEIIKGLSIFVRLMGNNVNQ